MGDSQRVKFLVRERPLHPKEREESSTTGREEGECTTTNFRWCFFEHVQCDMHVTWMQRGWRENE